MTEGRGSMLGWDVFHRLLCETITAKPWLYAENTTYTIHSPFTNNPLKNCIHNLKMIRWSIIVPRDKSRQKASQSSANLKTRVREPR